MTQDPRFIHYVTLIRKPNHVIYGTMACSWPCFERRPYDKRISWLWNWKLQLL